MPKNTKTNYLEECYLGQTALEELKNAELNFAELPKLYMIIASPPSRAVLMVAAALEVPLQLVPVNILEGEHLNSEYIEKNPQHTVPMLEEKSFCVWDSHAIAAYLVTSYGRTDELYPKEPRLRAIIDQKLHFDSSVLFPSLRSTVTPLFSKQTTKISQEQKDVLNEGLQFLEKFLDGKQWLAGDNTTIADICCIATVSSINEFFPIESNTYPNIIRWFEDCKCLPYYEDNNLKGLKVFGEIVRNTLSG